MPKRSLAYRLDEALEQLLQEQRAGSSPRDRELAPLLEIAHKLLNLPRENLKADLRTELERKSVMASTSQTAPRQTATVALRIKGVSGAIDFYQQAFGAREIMRFEVGRKIAHAEIAIGNSVIMLAEESPDWGLLGPLALGGSPVIVHLFVDDADAMVARASAAGARILMPVKDQSYGDRSGQVADPFGYTWTIAMHKEDMNVEEMHRRMEAMNQQQQAGRTASRFIPEGFRTVTPYLRAANVDDLIDFTKQAFGAEETGRMAGSGGGVHASIRIGDTMLFMGGGAPGSGAVVEDRPMAFHVYVEDTDAVYARALKSGAVSINEPQDQSYGERGASVRDRAGNHWYIATSKGKHHIPEGFGTVTPYLHPLRADPLIGFIKRAFGGEELARYATPDGVIHHAQMRISDAILEMGEAHGLYQPMACMFYLYVPDVDAMYRRALGAGGVSTSEPADQPYGDRTAAVKDAFGNDW